jgi:hypothetical protein
MKCNESGDCGSPLDAAMNQLKCCLEQYCENQATCYIILFTLCYPEPVDKPNVIFMCTFLKGQNAKIS